MGGIEALSEDQVMILKLNRRVTNPFNGELVTELANQLQEVKESNKISALVLTSTNDKFFSLGFDIPELINLAPQDFRKFFTAFNHLCLDLYTLPKPTIAALSGHTIAGGFILASCCDLRFMGQGKKFCALNEINLGIPVPYLSDHILRQLVGDRKATEMIYSGKMIPADLAFQMGIVDGLYPPEQLLRVSIDKAGELGNLPSKAFGRIKDNRTRSVAEATRQRLEEDIDLFVKFWYREEAQKRLKEAIKKF